MLLSLWVGVLGVAPAAAAPEIRFKVIDGKLCAKCVLRGPENSIPANVVIDLGTRAPLIVHERTARLLRLGPQSTVEVRFDGATLTNLRAGAAKLTRLEELTNEYASELDEIPAVAILGMGAFSGFSLQLEVGAGVLRLLPGGQAPSAGTTQPTAPGNTSWAGTYEERAYGYWLPGQGPDGFAVRVLFSTTYYDTIIDSTVADLAGSAAGAIDRLYVGSVNVARFVAFRPEDLSSLPEPRPDLVLGTNLLSHFRVTIDIASRGIRLEQTRPPQFPTEEREYFIARTSDDAAAIEAFLKAHPSSRLAGEASEKLLALRLGETPPDRDATRRAIRLRAESARKERRAEVMVALADELLFGERKADHELAVAALQCGLEYASAALNGRTVHDLNARLGFIALRRHDAREARRLLLSAAFGIPRDPLVNLWLGELYEQSGKPVRAWSRFIQAAISQNPPEDAMRGLDRLNRNAEFRAAFTMADAEQLLEGRTPEFHPADRYAVRKTGQSGRPVRLVELFTCIDHPPTQAPQMALYGLREYFEPERIAIIEYHMASPANDPLANGTSTARAAFYGVEQAPAAYFDGGSANTDGGSEKDVEKLFAAYRTACTERPNQPAEWQIAGQAAAKGNEIVGEIRVTGPAGGGDLRVHAILCERIVMVPGANGLVLHRYVARKALSPTDGFALAASAGGSRTFVVAADTARIGADLEQAISATEKERKIRFLMRPTFVDGGATTVVAFVQDPQSRAVLAACEVDVVATDRERKEPSGL